MWIRVLSLLAMAALLRGEAVIRLTDVAASAGVDFVLDHNPTPEKHMVETMAGGVATFDFDGDGRTDIFFTNGAKLPELVKSGPGQWNRLYRNLGDWRFADVTEKAGVAGEGYSMGAAVADYDNDGDVDLFVAGVYRNQLLRNNGDGTFRDVTESSGILSDRWSVAGGWFDYDNDGYLDLMVINYADWTPEFDRFCGDRNRDLRIYCHPKYFTPVSNQLFRNLGDGSFEDVTAKSGVGEHAGRGMSVAFADFDEDGAIDAFVTNDNLPNFLFRNNGDGTFMEEALFMGAALRDHGRPVASMAASVGDYDNDGLPDISVTALNGETYPLFRNEGGGVFEDATYKSGIAAASSSTAGWGNGFVDLDNDGWKDLFVANGHVNDMAHLFEASEYPQANGVYRNESGKFVDVSEEAGAGFGAKKPHRGAAFADFDGDGDLDVAVTALGERAEVWRNETDGGHWLVVRLKGSKSNRDGIGARVYVDGQMGVMTTAMSYASSSYYGVHFGLGAKDVVEELRVEWPSGAVTERKGVAGGRVLWVEE